MLCGWEGNRGSSVALAMRQTSVACPPDGLELSPGFYPGSHEQHRRSSAYLFTYLFTRYTSASSAVGVLNDYALYKSTHSLTLALYGLRPKEWI